MKAKNKVVRLRKQNPFMSTAEIARQAGVDGSYTRRVLLQNNLETNPPKPKRVVYCKVCRDITTDRGGIHKGKCSFRWKFTKLTCSWCTVPFYRTRKRIVQGYKLKLKNVYCTQKCYQDKRKYDSGNRQRPNSEMGAENKQDGIKHLYIRI